MSIESNESIDLSTLPPLPASWVWCLPPDICSTVASGSTPSPDKMFEGGGDIPFIKVYNLTHNGLLDFTVKPTFISRETHEGLLSRSRTQPGNVLINIVGPPLGKVSLVPDKYAEWNINQAIVVFRPHYGVSNRYIAYAFLTEAIMKRVTKLAKATAGQFNIGVGMCRKLLPVPLAPAMEQLRIVAKIEELFSDLDAGVAALERVRANLKRYRAGVLKAAVEGKLTEDWRAQHPDSEPASVLLERILTERRRQWEKDQLAKFAQAGKQRPKGWQARYPEPVVLDSGQPAIPETWRWASIDQLAVVVRGASPRPAGDPRFFGGPVPWITVGALTADESAYLTDVREGLTEAGRDASRLIHPDTLLLTNSGATLGVPKITMVGGCINDGSVALLFLDYPLKLYLHYFLRSQTKRLRSINQGAAQPNLNTGIVKALAVPLPPAEEQSAINQEVERRLSIVDEIESELNGSLIRAARLRQGILKRAFEGRLVPQDPTDEPAEKLLERIRQQRHTEPASGNDNRRTRQRRRARKDGPAMPLFAHGDEGQGSEV